ncbi:flagellar assembly protein FliW [Solibacillus sp. CAU 1738]|uniref:flagellar assembly protein FliW n=1 Tax=Solibacillus sp. CAU 1738 TaxID=3140363 RepID=UPI0032619FE0
MNIETKFLGEVEIMEEDIYSFKNGLLGFPDLMSFVVLPLDAELPLVLLQSTELSEIGFVVAFPFAFKKDYSFDLGEEDKEDLKIEHEDDVLAYTIVTLQEKFEDSTMNLLAPIVLNVKHKLGKQVVLQDNIKYPLRQSIGALEGSAK